MKRFILVLSFLFLVSCASSTGVANRDIGKIQSQLVTLTVECEKGYQPSCDKIPSKKQELQKLLQ